MIARSHKDSFEWSAVALALLAALFFGLLAFAFWSAREMDSVSAAGGTSKVSQRGADSPANYAPHNAM